MIIPMIVRGKVTYFIIKAYKHVKNNFHAIICLHTKL